jgi:hypothetical protein
MIFIPYGAAGTIGSFFFFWSKLLPRDPVSVSLQTMLWLSIAGGRHWMSDDFLLINRPWATTPQQARKLYRQYHCLIDL